MPVFSVDIDDPRLALYRSVSDPELLVHHGLFVAEGRLVIERVLQSGRFVVESALLNDPSVQALGPLFGATAPDVPLFRVDKAAFAKIVGFNIHRGSLALVRRPAPIEWRTAVASARLIVVLEAVADADNVGSVFRSAAAFGGGAVLLSPTCCDPLYRKAVRTSMGAVLQVPFARIEPWPAVLDELRRAGFVIAAFTPAPSSMTLAEFVARPANRRLALMLGSEGPGLTVGAMACADVRVRIPMARGVDSLNLAVAAAVALSWVSAV